MFSVKYKGTLQPYILYFTTTAERLTMSKRSSRSRYNEDRAYEYPENLLEKVCAPGKKK